MTNKKRIIITTLVIGIILVIFGGFSYAFFTADIGGSEASTSIIVEGGKMNITYDGGANINLNNIYPKAEAWATKTFTVTGTNTTDLDMYYKLSLVVDSNTFANNSITYDMTSTNTSSNGSVAPSLTSQNISNGAKTYSLGTGSFKKGSNLVHTYNLNFYFKNSGANQNSEQGKTIKAHVLTENKVITYPKNWQESTSGSLLYALKTNNTLADPLTTIGDPSLATEAVMASTPDDYGTSYYFRGAVENNYIVFANMCWRIVRVTGDGSIKLALYNYNPNSVANPCDAAQDGTTNAFARYTGTTYNSAFNTNYNDNAYLGFMYGATGASTYAATHANTNKSTILTNLETWYTAKLASYSANLADTVWCNDKSTVTDTSFDPWGITPVGTGIGTSYTYYSAMKRINDKQASLVCPKDNNGGSLSKFTADDTTNGNGALTYKIGLLTADEMVYSGTPDWNSSNTTQYLYKNTGGNWYWSLSPNSFDDDAGVFCGADYVDNDAVLNTDGLRPSVSLVSGTQITGGGTSSNPFKTV